MSEFFVRVFRLGKVGKHPGADTLSITQGPSGYPVVFKTGAFQSGDLAVHIPVDALVDTGRPEFSWLAKDAALAGDGRYLYRVKAAKVRNVPSYGFLVPVIHAEPPLEEGQDARVVYGVSKYDTGPCYQQDGLIQGDQQSLPEDGMVPHYDIEGMRRYRHCIAPGELVSVTEKIHGSNGRWAHLGGQLLCGSRTKFRTNSVWNRMAEKYGLHGILGTPENHGLVLYGEVYGSGIQDLTYGLEDQAVLFFDVYDSKTGRWFDVEAFDDFCYAWGLPTCPELYNGPYDAEKIAALAEGASTLPGANHVREGIVVKPLVERWDQEIGRVFLKQPGEGYLLRKNPEPAEEERIRRNVTFQGVAGEDTGTVQKDVPITFWQQVRAFFGYGI